MSANELCRLALALPEKERAALAHQLLIILEDEKFDADHEAEWLKEIDSRLDRVANGNYHARDWREVLAGARQSLTARSQS